MSDKKDLLGNLFNSSSFKSKETEFSESKPKRENSNEDKSPKNG